MAGRDGGAGWLTSVLEVGILGATPRELVVWRGPEVVRPRPA